MFDECQFAEPQLVAQLLGAKHVRELLLPTCKDGTALDLLIDLNQFAMREEFAMLALVEQSKRYVSGVLPESPRGHR